MLLADIMVKKAEFCQPIINVHKYISRYDWGKITSVGFGKKS
jgi:hypothetical protein